MLLCSFPVTEQCVHIDICVIVYWPLPFRHCGLCFCTDMTWPTDHRLGSGSSCMIARICSAQLKLPFLKLFFNLNTLTVCDLEFSSPILFVLRSLVYVVALIYHLVSVSLLVPSPPSSTVLSASDDGGSPLLKALTDYTRHFLAHDMKAKVSRIESVS